MTPRPPATSAVTGQTARAERDAGFTLIELLVVVIGVLELCQSSDGSYPASIAAGATAGTSGAACTGQTIAVSAGTTLAYFPISSSNLTGYIIGSTNANGSGKRYCYNSTKGGSVTTTATAVTVYRAAC